MYMIRSVSGAKVAVGGLLCYYTSMRHGVRKGEVVVGLGMWVFISM